jgi:acetolactate synthase-1/2/3 large subunit
VKLTDNCGAAVIARFLRARGVDRLFALCGGHIMPIWMRADFEGIRIIDVRDERAAVHMAQAHAELTGELGVALVTAGPGLTNAITGIANAHVSRTPLLVLSGMPPNPQQGRGALQDLDHTRLVQSITRQARTVREPALILPELDEAVSRAFGDGGDPGPVYLDFPTDTLRAEVPPVLQLPEHYRPKPRRTIRPARPEVAAAVDLLWSAKRPLVISGRGARGAGPELVALLDRLGAAYLDTGESRGLVTDDHPSTVAAMRGIAMGEADVVVTLGRRLDFQLAYGSPAVFANARFVRIGDAASELRDNRRGDVELFGTTSETLREMLEVAGNRTPAIDAPWIDGLRTRHRERSQKFRESMAAISDGADGGIHPNRLLGAVQARIDETAIAVIDGGDLLSFARVALSAPAMLDPGPFGCIGIGVPYGIAASLAYPERPVFVVTGDGSFGFNAIEIDTAVRHKAPLVIIVANNGAWQIEVDDQKKTHGKVVGTRLQFADHAAMARAFGMHGERVTRADELAGALDRALANRPALIDVVVTTDAPSSDSKSGLAWVPDLQAVAAWDDAERRWRASS